MSTNPRVRVYELDKDSQWEDKGTGHLSCIFIESKDGFCIVVRSEEDGLAILSHKITSQEKFQIQQDTVIQWTDDSGKDFALSFQELSDCKDTIEHILDIQKRVAVDSHDIDQFPSKIQTKTEQDSSTINRFTGSFPSTELANLSEIEAIITQGSKSLDIESKSALINAIAQSKFFDKFLELLNICEDLEAIDDLYKLGAIARGLIFFNDLDVLAWIVRDDVFPIITGMLEYDREFPNANANHREFLSKEAKFKEVIPINNEEIVGKIKQTYRIQYLKDVALARVIPDTTFSTLHSIVYFNHVEIIGYFSQNDTFLDQLFGILSSESSPINCKKDVMLFLREMCLIVKTLQQTHQAAFYKSLGAHGLFALFEHPVDDLDETIRTCLVSILAATLDHDPSMVRKICMGQIEQNQRPLLDIMIEQFLNETDQGLLSQKADLIKALLDTTGAGIEGLLPQPNKVEKDVNKFLDVFYKDYAGKLFKSFEILPTIPTQTTQDGVEVLELESNLECIIGHLCALLSFAISQHAMFCKNYLLNHDILKNCAILLKAKSTHTKLPALRVFRTCIGLNDDFYRRLLMKQDIFGPIFAITLDTNGKYNLLNSACLEFFDYILKRDGNKQLISYIVTNFKKFFKFLSYVDVFKGLLTKYEQYLDVPIKIETENSQQKKDGWQQIDAKEEAYFNEDTDDEAIIPQDQTDSQEKNQPSPTVSGSKRMLVDYADEEDDLLVRKTVVKQPKMKISIKETSQQ